MKKWEDMSCKERAEQTYKDIKRRQELRAKGKKDAEEYGFEQCFKSKDRVSRIRCKSYRGK